MDPASPLPPVEPEAVRHTLLPRWRYYSRTLPIARRQFAIYSRTRQRNGHCMIRALLALHPFPLLHTNRLAGRLVDVPVNPFGGHHAIIAHQFGPILIDEDE